MKTPDSPVQTRVLVVEDEALIALVLQDMLEDFGCEVVGPAATIAEAQALSAENSYDIAILDVRLNGDFVFPVAERIAAAGCPIIFATGGGGEDLPPHFQPSSVLQKPFAASAVEEAVRKAIGERQLVKAA